MALGCIVVDSLHLERRGLARGCLVRGRTALPRFPPRVLAALRGLKWKIGGGLARLNRAHFYLTLRRSQNFQTRSHFHRARNNVLTHSFPLTLN